MRGKKGPYHSTQQRTGLIDNKISPNFEPPAEDRISVEVIAAEAAAPNIQESLDVERESDPNHSTRRLNPIISEREVELALPMRDLEPKNDQQADEPIRLTEVSASRTARPGHERNSMSEIANPAEIGAQTDSAQDGKQDPTYTAPENDGWSPLHAAVEAGDRELVQKLVEKGELLEAAAPDGRKPLLIAAEKGFVKIVELLASNASVESFNEVDHSTALIRACEQEHGDVVKFLIENGANIEARSKDGRTPLLITVASQNYDLVKYLLQHGADKTIMLEDGTTAEVLAKDDAGLLRVLKQNYLLQGPEIGANKSDPQLRFRYVRAPEGPKNDDQKAACRAIQAEIIQFYIGHREERSQPLSVSMYELLYGKGPEELFNAPAMSPPPGSPVGSRRDRTTKRQPTFTWYYIPANNVRSLYSA